MSRVFNWFVALLTIFVMANVHAPTTSAQVAGCPSDGEMQAAFGFDAVGIKPVATGQGIAWEGCKWNWNASGVSSITMHLPGDWQATVTLLDETVAVFYGPVDIGVKGFTIRYLPYYTNPANSWVSNPCLLLQKENEFGMSQRPQYGTVNGNLPCDGAGYAAAPAAAPASYAPTTQSRPQAAVAAAPATLQQCPSGFNQSGNLCLQQAAPPASLPDVNNFTVNVPPDGGFRGYINAPCLAYQCYYPDQPIPGSPTTGYNPRPPCAYTSGYGCTPTTGGYLPPAGCAPYCQGPPISPPPGSDDQSDARCPRTPQDAARLLSTGNGSWTDLGLGSPGERNYRKWSFSMGTPGTTLYYPGFGSFDHWKSGNGSHANIPSAQDGTFNCTRS